MQIHEKTFLIYLISRVFCLDFFNFLARCATMLSDTITNDDKKKETDHPKVSITTFGWWSASFFKESTNMYQMFVFLDTSKQSLERRFLATDTLQTVLDYLTIEGFHHEEYKVLSSWPRRDVSIFF